jgi:hypothetical protein
MAQCNTSLGVITGLVAKGAHDNYLTVDPSITFFKNKFMKHTNFALESSCQQWNAGGNSVGQKASLRINRQGDLVYWMYVVLRLPGLANLNNNPHSQTHGHVIVENEEECLTCGPNWDAVPANDGNAGGNTMPRWTNSVGHYLINSVSVTIGGQVIDTLTNEFMYIWEELSGKTGKRLTEMVLKTNSQELSQHWSMFERCLYVPLPFFFTMTSGTVLPLVSLQFHDVKVFCDFNSIDNAIVNYRAKFEGHDTRTVCRPSIGKSHQLVPITTSTHCEDVNNNHITTALEICYVYLDVDERAKFAEGAFEMLITQVQVHTHQTSSANNPIRIDFNHAVIELIWAVRKSSCADNCDWFNFSGVQEAVTGANRDPVVSTTLKLNNQARFGGSEVCPSWFRLVQPYQHHSSIPEAFIYVYSFALFPEDPQPTGTLNFSRIDNATLTVELDKNLFADNSGTGGQDYSGDTADIIIIARNYNVLRIRNGLGGMAYAN